MSRGTTGASLSGEVAAYLPVMEPGEVVDAALAALSLGDVVYVPGLGDEALTVRVEDSQWELSPPPTTGEISDATTLVSIRVRC